MVEEPDARVDDERGPSDQQRIRFLHEGARLDEFLPRDEFAEEHDIGLEHSAARAARHQLEVRNGCDLDVTVWAELHGIGIGERRIELDESLRDVGAREQLTTPQAENPVVGSVQIDHALGTGSLVQPIDILSDDAVYNPVELEIGERTMTGVRPGCIEAVPAELATRPISLPMLDVAEKLAEGHRRSNRSAFATVIGDPGVCAQAGAGKYCDATPAKDVCYPRDIGSEFRGEGDAGWVDLSRRRWLRHRAPFAIRRLGVAFYDRLNTGVFNYVSDVWQCSSAACEKGHIIHVIRLANLDSAELRDYRDLTDVVLRRLSEPAGGLYIAESTKVIGRALAAGHRPRSVLTLEKWLPEIEELLAGDETDVPVYVGEAELLERLTGFSMHRGALASMHRPALAPVEDIVAGATRIIVLEDIVDHTNVGAIFRSVAGLGADAVLITPRCADPLYRRSVRVSMGTVLQVPWTRLPEWPIGADILRGLGFQLAALALSPDAVELDEFAANAPAKVALIVGTEGDGLSRAALGAADAIVTIPMMHGVDSLNVASASAVALYALGARRR